MIDFAFLDSGTGGIPYLLKLKEMMPEAECVYIGDTANFPYGVKQKEDIIKCVISVVRKIILKFNPKVIVIACNTMSVNALDALRSVFPETIFVGTVPAIKLAASLSKNRKLGLLATNSTCESPYNKELMAKFAADCELITRADPKLISFIEHESFSADQMILEAAVLPSVDYFRAQGCDAIILGCTHFLNLVDVFQKVAGSKISIVDSREGVCKRAIDLLDEDQLPEKNGHNPVSELYITGFYDKKDKKEYDIICNCHNISFGGILE